MDLGLQANIKKEYRNFENWLNRTVNIAYAFLLCIGLWIAISTILVGAAGIYDGTPISFLELQVVSKSLIRFIGALTMILIILFYLPRRIQNIFAEIAKDRIARFEKTKNQFEFQTQTTESILLNYGLIAQADIDNRNRQIKRD